MTSKGAMRDLVLALAAVAIAGLLALVVYQNYLRFHRPQLTTTWQAVTLVDGSVYYGRIAHLGSDHPVLRDAFSIRTDGNPAAPARRILRGRDGPHGADHMIFPASSILHVEPIGPDSEVGRLIEAQVARR